MSTLFIIGLLLSPIHQVDLKAGSAVVQDDGYGVLVPGYHLSYGDVHIGLQMPLRIHLVDSKLRANDVDELQDYGRIIRRIEIGDLVEVGPLRNVSDPQHLVLDHFFNRINDDEPRTALILKTQLSGFKYTFFADQILGPPIVAALMALDAQSTLSLDASLLLDTDAPSGLTNDRAHQMFGAGGLSLGYRIYRRGTLTLTPYVSVGQTHLNATGGHLGLHTRINRTWGWRLDIHTETMGFTQHYVWAPFDLMYLITRARNNVRQRGATATGWGGRLRLSLSKKHIQFGAQTSGAFNSPQQVHLGWIKMHHKPFSLFGVLYAGRHDGHTDVFAASQISGALSAQLALSSSWMIESSIMHVHRRPQEDYQHFLEAALFTNWRISFQ